VKVIESGFSDRDYDHNFDQMRLASLAAQNLSNVKLNGVISFRTVPVLRKGADYPVEWLEHQAGRKRIEITKLFDAANEELLQNTNFYHYLVPLIEDLVVYRQSCDETPNSAGIIHIDDSLVHINWLNEKKEKNKTREVRSRLKATKRNQLRLQLGFWQYWFNKIWYFIRR